MKLGLGTPAPVADVLNVRPAPELLLFVAKPWPAPPANDNGVRKVKS